MGSTVAGAGAGALAVERHRRELEARGAGLAGILNAATAGLVEVIAEALAIDAWHGWGIHTPEHWAGLRFGLSPTRARRLVAAARALGDLPVTRAAFAAGELSEDHIGAITRAQVGPFHDREVTELARHATVGQLRYALTALPKPTVEPEQAAEPTQQAAEPQGWRRHAVSSYDDNRAWQFRASAEPHEGALIDKALAAATDKLFRARHDPTADPDDDAKTEITTIDALVHLARVALDAMDPATRDHPDRMPSERYVANIHLRADQPDWAPLHLGPLLPPHLRQELTCDALVRAWVTDHAGTVNLGRSARVVSPKLRTVIEFRDSGCRIPGCSRTRWLLIHHIHHWEHGGVTDTWNLVSLCPEHHRAAHRGELVISGNADGDLVFADRHGHPIGPAPPRPPTSPLPDAIRHLGHQPAWTNRAGEHANWHYFNWTEPPTNPN